VNHTGAPPAELAASGSAAAATPVNVVPVSSLYRSYALWMLLLIYTCNFLDRQIVNILAEPMKRDLGLMDWQLGMLTGLAFAVFYTVLGIPIARLAESRNRSTIISVSLAIWSAMTALCGLAQSFGHMLLARIGVGVGEAGCSPAAHSLIVDYTPREQRASALAFYSMGVPLGTLLGMVFGGLVADTFGWRYAFLIAGLPGVALAVIARVSLREVRIAVPAGRSAPRQSVWEALSELRQKRAFCWTAVGAALTAFISYGQSAFFASFFFRNHSGALESAAAWVRASTGLEMGQVALVGTGLGIIIGVTGVAGTAVGGWLADRGARRNVKAYATVPAWAAIFGMPAFLLTLLMPGLGMALLFYCVTMFLKSIWSGPVYAVVQSLASVQNRATASAVLLFVVNIVGLGLGPLCVGVLSDVFARGSGEAAGLRWGMACSAVAGALSAWAFFRASRTLQSELPK